MFLVLGHLLIFGLSVALPLGLLGKPNARVQAAEASAWSWKKASFWLLVGLIIGLINELLNMLLNLLFHVPFNVPPNIPFIGQHSGESFELLIRLYYVFTNALGFGLYCFLIGGLCGKLNTKIQPVEVFSWKGTLARARARLISKRVIYPFCLFCILIGLSYLLPLIKPGKATIAEAIVMASIVMLVFGLGFWLVLMLLGILFCILLDAKKQLPENLHFSPNDSTYRSAKHGLTFGLVVGLIILFVRIPDNELLARIGTVLVFGLPVAVVCEMIIILRSIRGGSISKQRSSERLRFSPNESIRRSVKYALGLGLVVGLTFMLARMSIDERLIRIASALAVGLLIALFLGLGACVQHYTLRFWLWRSHLFPWQAVHFLDDATSRILLQRTGGNYRFAHRLIRDSFLDG